MADHNEAISDRYTLDFTNTLDGGKAAVITDTVTQCGLYLYSDRESLAFGMVEQQAERIAELEKETADLHTTMFAAAVEIQEHWDAHCDAEGYGPANLMHRLERGIASQYGYDAKTLQRIEAERDQLRAEVERLRANSERYVYLRDVAWGDGSLVYFDHRYDKDEWDAKIDAAIAARTTHKETE